MSDLSGRDYPMADAVDRIMAVLDGHLVEGGEERARQVVEDSLTRHVACSLTEFWEGLARP
jgi:hypothetical protein